MKQTPLRRALGALAGTLALSVALTACAGDDLASDSGSSEGSSASAGGSLTIASQSFAEAELVSNMYQLLLEDAGYDVTLQLVDARDAYMADFPGDVDVVPEYVGGIVNFLNTRENGANAEAFTEADGQDMADAGADLLDAAGITLLDVSEAADANAYFVTQDYSDANGVTALSDLEGQKVVLAAAPDCEGRADCEAGLEDVYGIDITKLLPLGYASEQTYSSVIDGESDLGQTSTTDGTLESQGLVVLDDDQGIQPAQNLVPAISTEFLDAHPDVADVLDPLMAALDTDTLAELNGRISVDRAKPADVAQEFLTDAGLL
ncbi:ABC transporter substrate-binding protein [Nocardioides bruguierae]|uniref:ABC transporter substrate-binding protein n=1 Tax=Nocardioides bruguierae TaxID=2945102 RepID=UPI0020225A30|nr:ABC transporter substrate-binding protein [Nocardioides bruguierae]MCL8026186.1 ABC transporter substrate-binding protein [Nocardioides bruguierae]